MISADFVLRGARIGTADPTNPWAESLAARGDQLIAVGTDAEIAEVVGRDTEVVDGAGRVVIPGVVDSHNHLRLGSGDSAVQLAGATTLAEIHGRIAA